MATEPPGSPADHVLHMVEPEPAAQLAAAEALPPATELLHAETQRSVPGMTSTSLQGWPVHGLYLLECASH